ncbi:uncharacterized protein FRV6_10236 [Fusarium oxysporum]|uniref:Uncharacterized protein n=1 Tax=Fusarium oxysporum TaxID=5507 RepID=A0A2H3TW12_FUSOX|nr:uncharacterized protein FRV6_10236 [Fusarium oxysporum]
MCELCSSNSKHSIAGKSRTKYMTTRLHDLAPLSDRKSNSLFNYAATTYPYMTASVNYIRPWQSYVMESQAVEIKVLLALSDKRIKYF